MYISFIYRWFCCSCVYERYSICSACSYRPSRCDIKMFSNNELVIELFICY